MKLINNTKDLLTFLQLDGETNLPISNFQIDSRKVKKNSVFFGLTGLKEDGSFYAEDAINKGASLAIIRKSKISNSIAFSPKIISVKSPEKILINSAKMAIERYQGIVIGVTGSNGKTTTKNILNTCIKIVMGLTKTTIMKLAYHCVLWSWTQKIARQFLRWVQLNQAT